VQKRNRIVFIQKKIVLRANGGKYEQITPSVFERFKYLFIYLFECINQHRMKQKEEP